MGAGMDYELHFVLLCPCGIELTGDTEEHIVTVATDHLRSEHPDIADHYEREHILLMARRAVKPQ